MATKPQTPPEAPSAYSKLPRRLDPLKASASAFPRNLAVRWKDKKEASGYAVIHKTEICFLNCNLSQRVIDPFEGYRDSDDSDSYTFINEVKWCPLDSGQTVLVITSFAGFLVMDEEGNDVIFQYLMTSGAEYARGISSIRNMLAVGLSSGYVMLFSVEDKKVDYGRQLQGQTSPVYDLAASQDGLLAAGDEDGNITVWKEPLSKEVGKRIDIRISDHIACVCLAWWKDVLISAGGDGKVRMYNGTAGTLLIEISAHGRWISSLDVAHENSLILTASEDSTVSVWKISEHKHPKVTLVHTSAITNSMLVGGRFSDSTGSTFAVSAYDSTAITEFGHS